MTRRCLLAALAPLFGRTRELAPLPRGIAGQFVGTHGGRLIVAGGSYWSSPPWQGGRKMFADEVYTLDAAGASWELAGRLAQPLAYGAAVTTDRGVICAGGQTEGGTSASVFLIRRDGFEQMPDLPRPCAFCAAGIAGGSLYVAGEAFFELPLREAPSRWRERPAWAGPPRILPSAAGCDGPRLGCQDTECWFSAATRAPWPRKGSRCATGTPGSSAGSCVTRNAPGDARESCPSAS